MAKKEDKVKEDKAKEFNEYAAKLENEKIKLHIKYILSICIGISAMVVICCAYDKDVFIGKLELAGTITSIVLSVVAIIMSISGEGKTEGIRNQMTELMLELKNTVNVVNKINADVNQSIEKLQLEINKMSGQVNEMYINTADDKNNPRTTVIEKITKSQADWNNKRSDE